jgi:hypothetical protein
MDLAARFSSSRGGGCKGKGTKLLAASRVCGGAEHTDSAKRPAPRAPVGRWIVSGASRLKIWTHLEFYDFGLGTTRLQIF